CELGDDLLEVGPGPELTTDVLRRQAARVTAVELDLALAGELAARLGGGNLRGGAGGGGRRPGPAGRGSFPGGPAGVQPPPPPPPRQDAALAELAGVLRPGGLLAGSDGLDTPARRELHADDVFVPVDPGTLGARLGAAGFGRARVDVAGDRLRFAATR